MLFMPGNAQARLLKAPALDADAFVFDLEDGVAARERALARSTIAAVLPTLQLRERERIIRINPISSADFELDMRALPFGHFDTLLVPKVERLEDLVILERQLGKAESACGLPAGGIRAILTLETPLGIFNALAIAQASARCCGLFFGAGDYAAATGIRISRETLQWPRSVIVAAAGAVGCDAIDTPYFGIRDLEGTFSDAVSSRHNGFSGKGVFHPLQIDPVHRALSPTDEEAAHAQRVIATFTEMSARGVGVALVDNQFVAIDLLPRLERLVQLHALARGRQGATLEALT